MGFCSWGEVTSMSAPSSSYISVGGMWVCVVGVRWWVGWSGQGQRQGDLLRRDLPMLTSTDPSAYCRVYLCGWSVDCLIIDNDDGLLWPAVAAFDDEPRHSSFLSQRAKTDHALHRIASQWAHLLNVDTATHRGLVLFLRAQRIAYNAALYLFW